MTRRALAIVTACSVAVSAAVAVASCAVDPYLTCGATCVDAGLDAVLPDVAVTDAGPTDASFDGIPSPPDCGTAPSCLQNVPAGWTPVAFAAGSQLSCPTGFTQTNLVTSPSVGANACTCSACTSSGAWSCGGETVGVGGLQCTQNELDAAVTTCWGWGGSNRSTVALSIDQTGSVTCGTSTPTGNGKVTTTPAALCTPNDCTASVCGQAGFSDCISQAGDASCPSGFPTRTLAGSSATVSCNACPTCALANADAGCTTSLELYNDLLCAGTVVKSYTSAIPCTSVGQTFMSLHVQPATAATPNCGPPAGNAGGTAQLKTPVTICCP
ncbi:MAG TPA: hypothetical protein VGH28_24970 [Polyangiaceae bacterium]|jgi:hypothetical protein